MALMIDNCGEGILLSLDSHKSVPAPFLTKTYQLVDDPATDHIVSWGEDDTTFVVWRPPEFARDLLPNYFKHNNFSSFVRQLNTYGFRKIVPDRWEFANEFFKKGEKHLLCEIHRRKTAQPTQLPINHHHHQYPHSPLGSHHVATGPGFFPFPQSRGSNSPTDSDDHFLNWCDSPPPLVSSPPSGGVGGPLNSGYCNMATTTVTALSEDNERLRRSNTMLMSELNHMRKLYNDIIYFVQNHVKPVTPSNSYPGSLLLCSPTQNSSLNPNSSAAIHKPLNQVVGYYPGNPKQTQPHHHPMAHVMMNNNSNTVSSPNTITTSKSTGSVRIIEDRPGNISNNNGCKTKLFGVPLLHSKKRLHPEYNNGSNHMAMEASKARLILEKDHDLGLHLMPPSTC
ncbi:heat stress transcription factor B-4 [Argentina anserina]|uniref:heat stress transcription factor B-4 n=1 Tax=Argentina anserina TaxID=57926 RepID=UPI0021765F82|nr:heat stress transcription factor B-4 [Potentilla anserina]